MKKKVLVILGSTATGKTDLGLKFAKIYNGELVAADSRQVYIGLDIGTGKEPGKKFNVEKNKGFWVVDGVKIHMYDVTDPTTQYTLHDYVAQSKKVIIDILEKDKLPIIVGGTGLYIKGLLEDIPNLSVPLDSNLRQGLEGMELLQLQEKLKEIDPKRWDNLNPSDQKNPRRLIRQIELVYMNPYIDNMKNPKIENSSWDVLKIGLCAPRPLLNERIDLRVESRISEGLIREGEELFKRGLSLERMKALGLEYGLLGDLLSNKISKEEFAYLLKIKIHQYAKRQMTWFQKEGEINWTDITNKTWNDQVESKVKNWYYKGA
jgi:tRNA dimethylallyltransferase